LGLLAPRLEDAQLREMLQKLCEKCTTSSKKEEHRDIAVIGLKTTAQAVTDSQADVLIDIVMPTLVASVAAKVSSNVPGIIISMHVYAGINRSTAAQAGISFEALCTGCAGLV
jgi:predicted protein tyrosine phosphatase